MHDPVGLKVMCIGGVKELAECRCAENNRINSSLEIEKDWWGGRIIGDERISLESGELMRITQDGSNYRLISPLRSRQQPDSLRPLAYCLLLTIQARWRLLADELAEINDVFLSISSLYRSQALQKRLQTETYLASNGFSSHCAGAAIDFHAQGYYLGKDRKSVISQSDLFNPDHIMRLKTVLEQLVREGYCHLIVEKGYQIQGSEVQEYDAVYHVCVSPYFL